MKEEEKEKKKNAGLSKTDVLHLKTHHTQSGHPLTLLLHTHLNQACLSASSSGLRVTPIASVLGFISHF